MTYRIAIGNWQAQETAARSVRHDVFILEQGIPVDMEWDEMDAASLHAVAFDEEEHAIGTARLLPDGHIGRMAVLAPERGRGIGSMLLKALIAHAQRRGDQAVVLHAQIHALPFYLRHEFEREGDEFMEAGIPHVLMRRKLCSDC